MMMQANAITGPFVGYHGNPDLKAMMLEATEIHVQQDQVVQGIYGDGEGDDFRGCFIGCTAHALDNNDSRAESPDAVFDAYGFPIALTRICEAIFEGLPAKDAPQFFKDVPPAISVGADLSRVHWKFLDWMLSDTFAKFADEAVKAGCADALAVISDLASGGQVPEARARAVAAHTAAAHTAAAYAAAGAAAAAAAGAAAAAYAAAGAAADAAAYAAAAADAAAAAAAAAAADAYAARASRWQEFAAKLIEFIKEAPGT